MLGQQFLCGPQQLGIADQAYRGTDIGLLDRELGKIYPCGKRHNKCLLKLLAFIMLSNNFEVKCF